MVRSRRKKFSVAGSVFCSTFWGTFNLSTYVGTYRESIIVRLTSCLTGLDSTKLVNLYPIQHKQSSWILIGETGGQPYSDTSPYKVSECSLYLPAYNGTYMAFSAMPFFKVWLLRTIDDMSFISPICCFTSIAYCGFEPIYYNILAERPTVSLVTLSFGWLPSLTQNVIPNSWQLKSYLR